MLPRLLSYTEISTALSCPAQHAFAYTGRLTGGTTLKARQTAPILSDGRAWGAMVAAWHATGDRWAAYQALVDSLASDAQHEIAKGFTIDPERTLDQAENLGSIFDHYCGTVERLAGLGRMEDEINVPILGNYRFHCYLDGHQTTDRPRIAEFKLRESLTPSVIIERQPQYRWYALAWAAENYWQGPVGVLVDERLKMAPALPRINKNGKPSHDKRQYTKPEWYLAACAEAGEDPSDEALEAFKARRWHQRVELIFTPGELDEAVEELEAAARLIDDLDYGGLYPIRNGKRANCQSCRYTGVCADPTNDFLINSLFERTEPKRLRGPRPEGVR